MNPYLLCDYEIEGIIGEGGFAQVFMAVHKATSTRVAIKQIPKFIENTKNHDRYMASEIEILKKIRHPFVCTLYEVLEDAENVYLVMEYIENGSLLDEVNSNGPLNERDAAVIFSQLMMVLKYLHTECHIAHRDIKPENILLDENHNIRLIDFGFSMYSSSDHFFSTQCGSILYSAPELVRGEEYDCRVDIWSCGILLYAVMAGYFPFDDDNTHNLSNQIIFSEVQYPKFFSANAKDLLQKMLTKNPNNRITIDEIFEHPWVKDQINSTKEVIEDFKVNEEYIKRALQRYEVNSQKIMESKSKNIIYKLLDREYLTNMIEPAYYLARKSYDLMKSTPMIKKMSVIMPMQPRNHTMVSKKIYIPALPRRRKISKTERRRTLQ